MSDVSENSAAAKNMAVLLENIAVFSGLLAYAHSASKTLDHRLTDVNKNLKTTSKELGGLVKELGDGAFAQEVDGLVAFLQGAHIESTHVSWKELEGVGVVTIHGVNKEKVVTYSVSLRFGEKERLDAKDRSRGVAKGWGQTEEIAAAEAQKPKSKEEVKKFPWTVRGMECATRKQEGRPPPA